MNEEEFAIAEDIYYLLSFPITKEKLETAYSRDMIRKEDLIDKQKYFGYCRNSTQAVWDAKHSRFEYTISGHFKGDGFVDYAPHPEDSDDSFDIFIPMEEI